MPKRDASGKWMLVCPYCKRVNRRAYIGYFGRVRCSNKACQAYGENIGSDMTPDILWQPNLYDPKKEQTNGND